MRKTTWIFLITGAVFLLAASVGAAEQGAESSNLAAWKDFGWRVLNFVLFVGVVYKLVGKKVKEFFSGRRQQIGAELEELEKRKAKAQTKLEDVEQSIADMESKRREILDDARKQGETLKQGIIEKAQQDAEKIKNQAKVKAEQEMQQMMDALRAEMAEKIIASAEKTIVDKLGKNEQEQLIDNYLTKVVLN